MIGQRLNHSWTVVAAVPKDSESWTVLAIEDRTNDPKVMEPYVVATVYVAQLPTPQNWDQGHYFGDIDKASKYFTDLAEFTDRTSSVVLALHANLRKKN